MMPLSTSKRVRVLTKLESSWDILQTDARKNLKLLQTKLPSAIYPGQERDTLFNSTYLHKHHREGNCEGVVCSSDTVCAKSINLNCMRLRCDSAELLVRKRLEGGHQPELRVRVGAVASEDTVM
ncbi:hypothetical protein QBC40DRAFT_203113, partial [Triangularia verruculosa]